MGFLKSFSEQIHFFVKENFTDSLILPFQIGLKMLLLFAFFFVIDILLRVTITLISRIFVRISNNEFLKFAYKAKVQNSIAHLFSLAFCFWLIDDIFWRHPKSFTFFERLLMFGQVLVFAMLAYRIVKTFEAYYIHKEDRYFNRKR
jgi:miniconductance mechanosensitive channel